MLDPFCQIEASAAGTAIFVSRGKWLHAARFKRRVAFVEFTGFDLSFCTIKVSVCRVSMVGLQNAEKRLDELCATWALAAIRQNVSGAATVLRTQVLQCLTQPEVSSRIENQRVAVR